MLALLALILLYHTAGYFALRFGKPKYLPLTVGPAPSAAEKSK